MRRLAANVSTLFTDAPLPERFARAAAAGFDAVELQFPYGHDAGLLRERLAAAGLPLVLHNLPPGDAAAGERGIACLPGREAEFRAGVAQGIAVARQLGAPQLNCLCGIVPPGLADDDPALRRTAVANLRWAADALADAGLRLLVEPINRHDMPGFWLHRPGLAEQLLDAVGHANLFIQHDLYHAQRSEGELAATLQRLLPRIAHIQIADNPGRHEPGSGEIHWPFVFAHLAHIGYRGDIGCEYVPAGRTEDGLGWMAAARAALHPAG